jgi:hypothetical protein
VAEIILLPGKPPTQAFFQENGDFMAKGKF